MEYKDYLLSEKWATKRQASLDYWGNKCALCYSSGILHVHHRTYVRIGNEEPTDLIVLCNECHRRHHQVFETSPAMLQFWARVQRQAGVR